MTRMLALTLLIGSLFAATSVISQEATSVETNAVGRYMACENHQGGNFYWVDTTCGKLWCAELGKESNDWKYLGQVKNSKAGVVGTYIPFFNKSGGGLFMLNTSTGEGWWTNGKDWNPLGKPSNK